MNLESSVKRIETSIFLNVAALEELLHAFDDIFGANGKARHTVIIDRTLGSIVRDVTELIRQISGTGRQKKLKISGMKYNRSPGSMRNKRPGRKHESSAAIDNSHRSSLLMLDRMISKKNNIKLWRSFATWRDLSSRRSEKRQSREARYLEGSIESLVHHANHCLHPHTTRPDRMQSPTGEIDYWGDETAAFGVVYERVSAGRSYIPGMLTSPKKEGQGGGALASHAQGFNSEGYPPQLYASDGAEEYNDDNHESYLSHWLHHSSSQQQQQQQQHDSYLGEIPRHGTPPADRGEASQRLRSKENGAKNGAADWGRGESRCDGEMFERAEGSGGDGEAYEHHVYAEEEHRHLGAGGSYDDYSHDLPVDPVYMEGAQTGSSTTAIIFDPRRSYEPSVEEVVPDNSLDDEEGGEVSIHSDEEGLDGSYGNGRDLHKSCTLDASTDTSLDGMLAPLEVHDGGACGGDAIVRPDDVQEMPQRRLSTLNFLADQRRGRGDQEGPLLDGGWTSPNAEEVLAADSGQQLTTEPISTGLGNDALGLISAPVAASTSSDGGTKDRDRPEVGRGQVADAFLQSSQAKRAQRRGTYFAGASAGAMFTQQRRSADDQALTAHRPPLGEREGAMGNQIDLELFAYAGSSNGGGERSKHSAAAAAATTITATASTGRSEQRPHEPPGSMMRPTSAGDRGLGSTSSDQTPSNVTACTTNDSVSAYVSASRIEMIPEDLAEDDDKYSVQDVPLSMFAHMAGPHGEATAGKNWRREYAVTDIDFSKRDRRERDVEEPREHLTQSLGPTNQQTRGGSGQNVLHEYSPRMDMDTTVSASQSLLLPKYRRQSMSAMPNSHNIGAESTLSRTPSQSAPSSTRTAEKPPLPLPRRPSVMVSRMRVDAPLPPPRAAMSPLSSDAGSGHSTPTRRRTPPPPPPYVGKS